MEYTSCLGANQMVDVLEAGRGSVSWKLTSPKIDPIN